MPAAGDPPPPAAIEAAAKALSAGQLVCLPTDTGYTITVPAGTTVTWTYTDTACDLVVLCPGHNVTFTGPTGRTAKADGAVLLTRTFTTAETFGHER